MTLEIDLKGRKPKIRDLYLVHIHTLVSLYQINTDICPHILLNHHFNHTIRNYNMFQALKGHLQGVQLIHSSSIYVTQYTLHTKLNFTAGDSFYWPTLPECIYYAPWRWPFKGWNMLQLRTVLIKWWFTHIRCICRCLFDRALACLRYCLNICFGKTGYIYLKMGFCVANWTSARQTNYFTILYVGVFCSSYS
jgi:hypothetical protein